MSSLRAAALLLLAAAAPPPLPMRVVSLNLCTDAYIILLAPERAVAVTRLAADPSLSVVAAAASGVPTVRASAESVLALLPDLVLAGDFSASLAVDRIAARGVRVERFSTAANFDDVRAQARRMGRLLGAETRAQAMIAAMDATLAAVTPMRKSMLGLFAARYTNGAGGIFHAAILAAGGTDVGTGGRIGLETLLARPPDLLLTAPPEPYPSLSTAVLNHPALSAIPRREIPQALTLCAGPWSAEAVALIAAP